MERSSKKKILVISILIIFTTLSILFTSFIYTNNNGGGTGSYVDKTPQFIHNSPNKILNNMINKKRGIYYYGFSTCPWCQELLPNLNSVLRSKKLKAYVVNIRAKNYTAKDNIKLENFFIKNVTKNARLTVPLIVMINKNKKVKVHVSTVVGHNAEVQRMTPKQKKKLTNILVRMCNWYQKN